MQAAFNRADDQRQKQPALRLGLLFGQRGRVGRGFADFVQRVEIGVLERFVVVRHRHHGILLIRPSAVVVHGNGDGVAFHAERFFQKRIGRNRCLRAGV